MEHPVKTIFKAFGIVLLAAIILYTVPQISRDFGRDEWLLTIGFFILFAILMLLQVYHNSSRLMKKSIVPSNPSQH